MAGNQANRGMAFEKDIDRSNRQYRDREIAQVSKVPTPVKVLRLTNGRIRDGFYDKKSTVDYFGTFRGRSIIFDAKSTRENTRFDLKNVHEHQIQHLIRSQNAGAACFLLVHFERLRRTFVMPLEYFMPYWMAARHNGRAQKSIPIQDFEMKATEVPKSHRAPVDYLAVVQKYWNFEEEKEHVKQN